MRVISYAFVLAGLAVAGNLLWTHLPGHAQQQPSTSQGSWPQSQANFPQTVVSGGGWGWDGGHASTAEQGMMEGMAAPKKISKTRSGRSITPTLHFGIRVSARARV